MEQFREAYANELFRRYNDPKDVDYGYKVRGEEVGFVGIEPNVRSQGFAAKGTPRAEADRIAGKMIESARRSGAAEGRGPDWFKHNPAMRSAARKVGIKTSPDFRKFIVEQSSDWRPEAEAQAMQEL